MRRLLKSKGVYERTYFIITSDSITIGGSKPPVPDYESLPANFAYSSENTNTYIR